MLPLVILDLDGTLIDASGEVPAQVWDAINQAKHAGMRFAVCTGRPCMGIAQEIAMRLDRQGWHIFQNGALICKPSGQALKTFALKEASLVALIAHARKHKLVLETYTPSDVFIERDDPLAQHHARILQVSPTVRNLMEVASHEPVVRAQWVLREEQLASLESLALPDIQQGFATSPTLPGLHFVSLTQHQVDKGSAVRILLETLNVDPSQVMAVGDSPGDVPMLEHVGHPMVMGNASEALRQRFPSLPSVEDAGVIDAIERAHNTPV